MASLDGARGSLPLAVMGDYDGPLRRIVLAAKHSARTDVTDFLDEAGARLGASLAPVLGVAGSPATAAGSLEGRAPSTGSAVEVWVVPAPSSWKRRLRGRQVALEGTVDRRTRPDRTRVSTALTSTLHRRCTPKTNRSIPTIPAGRLDGGTANVSTVDTELPTYSTREVLRGLSGGAGRPHQGMASPFAV